MGLHFGVGNSAEARRRCDGYTRHKRKDGVAQHCGDGEAGRNSLKPTVDGNIDVRNRPGSSNKFAHQHKQGDHRKREIPQSLGRSGGNRGLYDAHLAGDKIDANQRRHAKGHRHVDTQKHETQQKNDYQRGSFEIEHA